MPTQEIRQRVNQRLKELYERHLALHEDEVVGYYVPGSGYQAALNALTLKLAAELRGDGILVNSVCPGWVATDMGGAGGRPVEDGAASVVWAATLPDEDRPVASSAMGSS